MECPLLYPSFILIFRGSRTQMKGIYYTFLFTDNSQSDQNILGSAKLNAWFWQTYPSHPNSEDYLTSLAKSNTDRLHPNCVQFLCWLMGHSELTGLQVTMSFSWWLLVNSGCSDIFQRLQIAWSGGNKVAINKCLICTTNNTRRVNFEKGKYGEATILILHVLFLGHLGGSVCLALYGIGFFSWNWKH
jgi:hypothetical protein